MAVNTKLAKGVLIQNKLFHTLPLESGKPFR